MNALRWEPVLTVFGWTIERAWDKEGGYFCDSCAFYESPGDWRYRVVRKAEPGAFTPASDSRKAGIKRA